MIFISVGTHFLPFDRLLIMINSLISSNIINEEVVIQAGTSKISIKNSLVKEYFNYEKFINYLQSARIIICHAGPATIFQSIMFAHKIPIVVPRLKKYGEHVSDHQLYFAEKLMKNKQILLANTDIELRNFIISHTNIKPTYKVNNNISKKLSEYLSTI